MSNYVIKLVTGESVYARIQPKDEDKMVIVHNPLTWEEFFNEEGMQVSTLVQFCSGTDETEIPIAKTAIISIARMSDEFSAFYEAAVAMSEITKKAYSTRLGEMTARMYNKVQQYHAINHQKETGDLVAYFTAGSSESDTDTIH